ncbi:hypothetical protein PUNSTDRAFT_78857, partial [Punctularia strigosozonata HHB-11173 SS5]|uniref:uncharacterized protein n=1 Tax=Punctularia strigosozonata (strain HHB-11173) TaxID=741275 RepID=UPI000441791C
MHDFFTGAFGQPSSSTTATPADQAFVDAVVSRFGVPPLLTARLPDSPKGSGPSIPAFSFPSRPAPPLSAPSKPPVPSSPAAPAPAASFTPVRVAELPDRLADPRTLILDIRPHAAYTNGRLPRALSLSVPSTLLKRPLFNIARVGEMLPALVRRKLERWRESDFILVYDADTNTLGASSNVKGLLAKFHAEGVDPARLGWIQGGFQSVWRERRDFVDQDPPSDDESDSDPPSDPTSPQHALPPTLSQPAAAAPSLRARDLPMAAFFKSSTTSQLMTSAGPRGMTPNPQAFNPFFDTIRQNVELSHGITERIPLRLPASIRRRIDDLPFEWLRDIARRADDMSRSDQDGDLDDEDPTELVGYTDSFPIRAGGQSADDRTGPILLPDADARKQPKANDVDEGAESLAMQFYKIELAEQRRLTGVMQHHSKESVAGGGGGGGAASEPAVVQSGTLEPPAPPPKREFPFSITAGVEKGAKNRYRNIWPFEHARVRLRKRRLSDDDYINASFVQPLGTTKRYIATQGPLPATFADFWTLCWEQNVHVIVMLTREIEGSMVKCGNYWTEGVYGRLRLRHIETVGTPSVSDAAHQAANQHSGGTVKRVFELSHMDYPAVPPRVVTQMQYLDWPDMNVPSDPRTLLAFVKEVDRVEKAGTRWPKENIDPQTGIARHAYGRRPVLLHCSAGVGRTGGYIVIDAVLDGIRREMKKRMEAGQEARQTSDEEKEAMDVDEAEPVRELVEDIREQRMSLCQSLRQYVFVHQAIIE